CQDRRMHDPGAFVTVEAHLQGTVVALDAGTGDAVRAGAVLALVESMKLHHEVRSPIDGIVASVDVALGATVQPGDPMVVVRPGAADGSATTTGAGGAGGAGDLDTDRRGVPRGLDRPDLAEVVDRHALGRD